MAMKVNDPAPAAKGQPAETTGLSDAQFARIEELLLPGYELSKLMLEEYRQARTPAEPESDKG